ncbi:uracil-xanthine permease family protein [Paralcaligenes ureilyticus]|uniref:Xanthine/uracil permease n=1 Tax=Paralcaligenes ureilyticus TaxID=627131 RepID=A0A4R3MDF4_9BURK|nr:solute carrier family 23 protein [Paralcaligenes ureilyticus]TCT11162.1 xanthine/uracil permease [Paralcaligenes ureilyticus]
MAIFPRRIALPPTPPFKRPRNLVYASNEKPPRFTLSTLALQHAATALALIAYVLASASIGGLDAESTRRMITATVLGMALATCLQSWGGRLGSGTLLVQIPSPLHVGIAGMVLGKYGLGGLVMLGLVNGAVGLAASSIVPRLRALLPPIVAGVVVCIAGLSLIKPALIHTSSMSGTGTMDGTNALIGGVTLAVIVTLSVWGNHRIKLFALLIGIATGVALAAALGTLHGLEQLQAAPIFGLPRLPTPVFNVDPGVLGAVGVLALMTELDTFACVVLMHKMNDADWRRPNMRMVSGGIRANALSNFLAAWMGGYPGGVSSTNIALNHISRSTSRWVGLLAAAMLACIAFLPQVTLALILIPTPVIGAVELYAAAYLIVSGIELIASRAMDSRGIFIVGLSFVAGLGVMFLPEMAQLAPEPIRFMASNGIIVGGLTAIALNLVFRLGISQSARQTLESKAGQPTLAQQVVDFVEGHGANWSARRDVVSRAAQAALEGAEAIQAAGDGRRLLEVRGSFDEFNLDIELLHHGSALVLTTQHATSAASLLDVDDDAFEAELERTLANVSGVLLKRLADRLSSGAQGKYSYLRLHFDH